MSETYGGALVKSVSIENLVNQRAAVLERIRKATDLLLEANTIAAQANVGFPDVCMSAGYSRSIEHRLTGRYRDNDDGAGFMEAAQLAVDIGGWRYLMDESGIRSLMDARARADWDKQLSEKKVPALTDENIRQTFSALYQARGDMFERGVLNVFKSLSWCYKTNRPFAFGKRIVLRGLRNSVTGGRPNSFGYLNHRTTDELDDLVRVFSVLEGKPEPDHRDTMWSRISRQEREEFRVGQENELDSEYFHLRWFKNGNGHLTFKRPDLVARMNAILAKHYPGALPQDTHEEREAFDPVKVA